MEIVTVMNVGVQGLKDITTKARNTIQCKGSEPESQKKQRTDKYTKFQDVMSATVSHRTTRYNTTKHPNKLAACLAA